MNEHAPQTALRDGIAGIQRAVEIGLHHAAHIVTAVHVVLVTPGNVRHVAPRAGGHYVYITEAYGHLWGFLCGWILFLVYMSGGIAAVSANGVLGDPTKASADHGRATLARLVADLEATAELHHLQHAELELDTNELERVVTTHGMVVPAIGTGQAWGEEGLSFTSDDAAVRDAAIDRVKSHIPVAARLDAVVILGLIGVVVGLLATGSYFGFMTFLGVVSLAGIVVNNAIVLLDRIRFEITEHGLEPARAVIEASRKRLRPILLTTATTVGGLIPLWLGGGPMYEPMAIAIIFGLLFSTMLTLGVLPGLMVPMEKISYQPPTCRPGAVIEAVFSSALKWAQ